jgi:hypothetical protein
VPNSQNTIGDDGLYAYAGWKYITGTDPILINAEVPPLGKYLIGASIVLFHNQAVYGLFMGVMVLISLYFLSKEVLKNSYLAGLPVVLFSLEQLFIEQLRAPFLDLQYLLFLLLSLLFFLRKRYVLMAFSIGAFATTKFSPLSLLLVAVLAVFTYIYHRSDLKKFLISLFLIPLTILVVYGAYFLKGHTLIDFLKLQKYIFNFYATGAKGKVFDALVLLFTGQWNTWWDGRQQVAEWNFFWPVATVISVLYFGSKKMKMELKLVVFWSLGYFLFLSITPVWPRYFLLLLPFLYIISLAAVQRFIERYE